MTERVFERSAARRPMSVPIVYSSFVYRGPSLVSGVGHYNPCSPFAESETKGPHMPRMLKKNTPTNSTKNDVSIFGAVCVEFVDEVREVRGSGLEIAEFRAEDTLQQLSDCPGDTVHLETCWCSMVSASSVCEGLTCL